MAPRCRTLAAHSLPLLPRLIRSRQCKESLNRGSARVLLATTLQAQQINFQRTDAANTTARARRIGKLGSPSFTLQWWMTQSRASSNSLLRISHKTPFATQVKNVFQSVVSEDHENCFSVAYFDTRRVVGAASRCSLVVAEPTGPGSRLHSHLASAEPWVGWAHNPRFSPQSQEVTRAWMTWRHVL